MTSIIPPNAQPDTLVIKETLVIPDDGLESVLAFLHRFGSPSLFYGDLSKGWHCRVELSVRIPGSRVQVECEGFTATPLKAARSCAERLIHLLSAEGVVQMNICR